MTRTNHRSSRDETTWSILKPALMGLALSLGLGQALQADQAQAKTPDAPMASGSSKDHEKEDQGKDQPKDQGKDRGRNKARDSAKQSEPSDAHDQSADAETDESNPDDTPQAPTAKPPATPAAGSVVGWLEISRSLRDGPASFSWVSREDAGPSLQDVLGQIETVAEGEQYKGMVVYLDSPKLSMTQAGRIARAIKDARSKGKEVLAFAESYGLREYLIAASADKILLQHKGGVQINGLQIEEWYLGGMLEKIGVKADLVQIGKYKGAADPMTMREPSKAWDQNMGRLMDEMYAQVLQRIEDGRDMTKAEVEEILANAWAMSDQALVKNRVVDRLTNRDLINVTEIEFGDQFTWDQSMGLSSDTGGGTPSSPFAMFQMLFQKNQTRTTRPTIAVIHASGPIHSGKSSSGGAFSSESIGSKTLVELLGKVRDDDLIKGVVLRLDSPGGSALASEVMWQALRQVGQSKPVFASIGKMAASGGYYMACATDEIYVAPQSIVGSIGVVGGKVVLGDLYDMAGIHVRRRSRGPNADMFNSVEPFTDAQRKQLRKSMKLVYDQFTDRVAIGRGNRIEDISKVAKGRLFTGRTSVDKGLTDQIGGVDDAVADMAGQLDLKTGSYDVQHLPRPMSFQQFLSDAFTVASPARPPSSASPLASLLGKQDPPAALIAARGLIGPRAWRQVRRTLSGLMLLREESVLALMAQPIIVR